MDNQSILKKVFESVKGDPDVEEFTEETCSYIEKILDVFDIVEYEGEMGKPWYGSKVNQLTYDVIKKLVVFSGIAFYSRADYLAWAVLNAFDGFSIEIKEGKERELQQLIDNSIKKYAEDPDRVLSELKGIGLAVSQNNSGGN